MLRTQQSTSLRVTSTCEGERADCLNARKRREKNRNGRNNAHPPNNSCILKQNRSQQYDKQEALLQTWDVAANIAFAETVVTATVTGMPKIAAAVPSVAPTVVLATTPAPEEAPLTAEFCVASVVVS